MDYGHYLLLWFFGISSPFTLHFVIEFKCLSWEIIFFTMEVMLLLHCSNWCFPTSLCQLKVRVLVLILFVQFHWWFAESLLIYDFWYSDCWRDCKLCCLCICSGSSCYPSRCIKYNCKVTAHILLLIPCLVVRIYFYHVLWC